MSDEIIKVAVYTRVSTQEQAVEGTSLERQSSQLESYCGSQDWVIWQSYTDPGHTGKDGDRPGLKRLLADAKLGLFEKVVVYKLDRLARKLRLLLEIEEKLKDYGVGLHSVKETLDTSTPIGRTVFQMLGLVSEWERDTIVERTKAGRLQRYKEGCWGPGRPPFGYSYDRETKKLVIDKAKARIVRRIFDLTVNGKSLSYIAGFLNSEGVPPRRIKSKGWRTSAIRDIIINPIYKGTLVVNRHKHISYMPRINSNNLIEIKVPKIVSENIWESAQKHRKEHKRVRPPRKNKWLLQGLVVCGLCGYSFKTEHI